MTKIGLRERREALGLSRAQMALLARCSSPWVQALEAGLRPASSDALKRIEEVLAREERKTAA